MLTGTYFYQLDPKGRMRMPAALRDVVGTNLMVGYGSGEFLVVYTDKLMQSYYNEYSTIKLTDYEKQREVREFFGSMKPFNGDSQARYQIPQDMRESVGLKDEIVIIGALTWIEIWSKSAYDRREDDSVRFSRVKNNV